MLHQIKECIVAHQLFDTKSKLFLACSGGVDSMVCLDYLSKNHYTICGVVHCNFQLRGRESDADETLVRETAAQLGIPFYSQRMETTTYAKEHKVSIEMAARALRYDYFEALRTTHGYDYLVTAHHLDDSIETVLMRLISGTSLKGLMGIAPKNRYIVRPMLKVPKESLYDYAKKHKVSYREDQSNHQTIFRRNRIRNEILPLVEKLNPNYRQAFTSMMQIANAQEQLVADYIRSHHIRWNEDSASIDLSCLASVEFKSIIIANVCADFELNQTEILNLSDALFSSESKFFETKKGLLEVKKGQIQLLKDSQELEELLIDREVLTSQPWTIYGQTIQFEIVDRADVIFEPKAQYFDLASILFPLTLRSWSPGDRIKPMGMRGQTKKLQDVFQDKKYAVSQKLQAIILEDRQDILAIAQVIQNERTKVKTTGKVLVMRSV
jgi:tRNA(Ile)-lysidine synthase